MGNRGTTPSCDEEEIKKWGLLGHFENVRRGVQMRNNISKRQRDDELRKLLFVLQALLKIKEGGL